MEQKSLYDVIDTAIRREEEAYRFYMELHGKIDDPGVQDTLAWIAKEEDKHRQFLIEFREGRISQSLPAKRQATLHKIAEHQEAPDREGKMNSEDVYLVAAHRELNSHKFYSGLSELYPDGEVKDMLRRMASEELKHKEKMEYLYANTAFPQTAGG